MKFVPLLPNLLLDLTTHICALITRGKQNINELFGNSNVNIVHDLLSCSQYFWVISFWVNQMNIETKFKLELLYYVHNSSFTKSIYIPLSEIARASPFQTSDCPNLHPYKMLTNKSIINRIFWDFQKSRILDPDYFAKILPLTKTNLSKKISQK